MRSLLYITILSIFLCSCAKHETKSYEDLKWNVGYDPNHPECFDTIISEDGDSMLIIVGAIDSIP